MAQCTKSPPGVLWIAPPAVISGIGYLAGPKTKSGRVVPGGARRLCLHCILYIMFYINIRYIILFIIIYIIIYINIIHPINIYPVILWQHRCCHRWHQLIWPRKRNQREFEGINNQTKNADTTNTSRGICHSSMFSKNNQDPVTLEVQRVFIYIYIFIDLFFLNFVSGPSI
jgi:hypothetical protein